MALYKPSNFSPNLSEVDFEDPNGVNFQCKIHSHGSQVNAYMLSISTEDGDIVCEKYENLSTPLNDGDILTCNLQPYKFKRLDQNVSIINVDKDTKYLYVLNLQTQRNALESYKNIKDLSWFDFYDSAINNLKCFKINFLKDNIWVKETPYEIEKIKINSQYQGYSFFIDGDINIPDREDYDEICILLSNNYNYKWKIRLYENKLSNINLKNENYDTYIGTGELIGTTNSVVLTKTNENINNIKNNNYIEMNFDTENSNLFKNEVKFNKKMGGEVKRKNIAYKTSYLQIYTNLATAYENIGGVQTNNNIGQIFAISDNWGIYQKINTNDSDWAENISISIGTEQCNSKNNYIFDQSVINKEIIEFVIPDPKEPNVFSKINIYPYSGRGNLETYKILTTANKIPLKNLKNPYITIIGSWGRRIQSYFIIMDIIDKKNTNRKTSIKKNLMTPDRGSYYNKFSFNSYNSINYIKIPIPNDFVEPEMQYSLYVSAYEYTTYEKDHYGGGVIENISIFDLENESDNYLYLNFDCCNFNEVNIDNVFADIKVFKNSQDTTPIKYWGKLQEFNKRENSFLLQDEMLQSDLIKKMQETKSNIYVYSIFDVHFYYHQREKIIDIQRHVGEDRKINIFSVENDFDYKMKNNYLANVFLCDDKTTKEIVYLDPNLEIQVGRYLRFPNIDELNIEQEKNVKKDNFIYLVKNNNTDPRDKTFVLYKIIGYDEDSGEVRLESSNKQRDGIYRRFEECQIWEKVEYSGDLENDYFSLIQDKLSVCGNVKYPIKILSSEYQDIFMQPNEIMLSDKFFCPQLEFLKNIYNLLFQSKLENNIFLKDLSINKLNNSQWNVLVDKNIEPEYNQYKIYSGFIDSEPYNYFSAKEKLNLNLYYVNYFYYLTNFDIKNRRGLKKDPPSGSKGTNNTSVLYIYDKDIYLQLYSSKKTREDIKRYRYKLFDSRTAQLIKDSGNCYNDKLDFYILGLLNNHNYNIYVEVETDGDTIYSKIFELQVNYQETKKDIIEINHNTLLNRIGEEFAINFNEINNVIEFANMNENSCLENIIKYNYQTTQNIINDKVVIFDGKTYSITQTGVKVNNILFENKDKGTLVNSILFQRFDSDTWITYGDMEFVWIDGDLAIYDNYQFKNLNNGKFSLDGIQFELNSNNKATKISINNEDLAVFTINEDEKVTMKIERNSYIYIDNGDGTISFNGENIEIEQYGTTINDDITFRWQSNSTIVDINGVLFKNTHDKTYTISVNGVVFKNNGDLSIQTGSNANNLDIKFQVDKNNLNKISVIKTKNNKTSSLTDNGDGTIKINDSIIKDKGNGKLLINDIEFMDNLDGTTTVENITFKTNNNGEMTINGMLIKNTYIIDYNLINNSYYKFKVITIKNSGGILATNNLYFSKEVEYKTCGDSYTLIDIFENEDGTYSTGDSWSFKYNLEIGDTTINQNKNKIDTLSPYPVIFNGKNNYESGTISALIGDVDSNNYYENNDINNVDKLLQCKEFICNNNLKLLKDYKGNRWIVRTFDNPSYSIDTKSMNQVTKISFSWVEVMPNDISVVDQIFE